MWVTTIAISIKAFTNARRLMSLLIYQFLIPPLGQAMLLQVRTFDYCGRLKNVTFATPGGTPYVVNWKNQTINMRNMGHASNNSNILGYNSGIKLDKQVDNDTEYQALKNDPDWYTLQLYYSRYNHDSAVATINSLPDTSAYLATAGGTNNIVFNGQGGRKTDGGAINTLTAEEIAVATAKGWTVTIS